VTPIAWFLLIAVALVLLVILEGKRQERKYGRSGRGSMMRTGLLELQRHLEPERKVEILLEKREREIRVESGEKP
jgi:hypothetical protein